jgi:hypothetical protein
VPSPHRPVERLATDPGVGYHGAMEEKVFSDELEGWLRSDEPKTLGALNDVFDERSFAVAITLLMFPSALPIPTGGVTHVLEVVTLLLAAQIVIGRDEIWLPRRWRGRELGSTMTGKAIPFVIRRVRFFERHSHGRVVWLFEQGWFLRLLGVIIFVFTVGAIVAPPFSGLDTLPALGVVLIALSIILRDIAFVVAGAVLGTGGIALIITLGRAAAHLFTSIF